MFINLLFLLGLFPPIYDYYYPINIFFLYLDVLFCLKLVFTGLFMSLIEHSFTFVAIPLHNQIDFCNYYIFDRNYYCFELIALCHLLDLCLVIFWTKRVNIIFQIPALVSILSSARSVPSFTEKKGIGVVNHHLPFGV